MATCYQVGDRVHRCGSLRVGTITKAWDTASVVTWDYPRQTQRGPEIKSYVCNDYLYPADEYCEFWSRVHGEGNGGGGG